jgi:molybdopterin-containing oxidoreductase family iron-sulfur binding subunit
MNKDQMDTDSHSNTPKRQTAIASIPGYTMTERGPEVYAPADGPLEAPAKVIEKGPLYMGVEEVMPEVDSTDAPMSSGDEALAKTGVDRRDFLKLFSAAAVASSAACIRRPLEKAVPYVNQPVDYTVGLPTYFATTCGECASGCGITVKTSSGLPVKIEGNPEHPLSQGSTCATGQASLQGLFHPERRTAPGFVEGGRLSTYAWNDMYETLAKRLEGKKVAVFTGGSTGSRNSFYEDVLKKMGGSENDLYTYESNSLYEAISEAHQMVFGYECMPRPDMRLAKVIVGLGTDFLDVGVSPVFYAKNFGGFHTYRAGADFGKFIQFESMMTQTGAKADERHVVPPSSEIVVALLLMKSLIEKNVSGASKEQANRILADNASLVSGGYELVGVSKDVFDHVAEELLKAPSIVFAGNTAFDQNATMLQVAAALINDMIGAYGKTLFIDRGWMRSPVRTGDLARFMENAGKYDAVFFIDTNPVFTVPASFGFADVVKKIPMLISMQSSPVEMDDYAHVILPINHTLESWGDEHPVAGFWSVRQPVVRPVKDTRQAEDIFLWLLAAQKKSLGYQDYRAYLNDKWKVLMNLVDAKGVDYETFVKAILRKGFGGKLETRPAPSVKPVASGFKVAEVATAKGPRLLAPLDPRLGDGRGADKPILQEIGDSMTTIAWDSWVAMNPNTAAKMGFKRNDLLLIETDAGSLKVALYPLPGIHADAVIVNRGNGHKKSSGVIQGDVGVDPLTLASKLSDGAIKAPVTSGQPVKITKTGEIYRLAAMQKSHDIGNRTGIIKKYSIDEVQTYKRKLSLDDVPDLYPALVEDQNAQYRWGMSIDLTKCSGCGACMAACAIENNVPQVGREQILLGREMHWIRLDRYFAGDVDNPQVTYQPMMCQQCTHAPCEAVCPVIATSHDPEGINSMTYNRCIGTRYCANACPYKVRRFNWWTHKWGVMGDRPQDRMPRALNPEVTVRTRGVMEKCNFCVQRLRQAKYSAKEQNRSVRDLEVMTACAQVCPSDAITFGNLKDQGSRVSLERNEARSYLALGGDPNKREFGIKTLPNVSYMAVVAHREPLGTGEEGHGSGHGKDHASAGKHGEAPTSSHDAPAAHDSAPAASQPAPQGAPAQEASPQ